VVRILVVEKSFEARERIVRALARVQSVAVQGAVSGLQAVATAAVPDIIVTGIELQGGTGLELIAWTRAMAPRPRVVVVGLAATPEVWRRHLAAGADRFVEPDATMEELREVVAKLAAERVRAARGTDPARLSIAAGIAHDLADYFTAIEMLLETLVRSPDASLLADARAAVDQAHRLGRTLDAADREAVEELVDLGTIVRRTVRLLGWLLPPHVAVRLDVGLAMPPVHGIVTELEQLALNVVLATAEAMPDGGQLAIRAAPISDAICFEVIDLAGRARISGGRRLDIARRIVEHHRGVLELELEPIGGGTSCVVFLPIGVVTSDDPS
jgi:DNA-binding NarL/FixJ family response regulator